MKTPGCYEVRTVITGKPSIIQRIRQREADQARRTRAAGSLAAWVAQSERRKMQFQRDIAAIEHEPTKRWWKFWI